MFEMMGLLIGLMVLCVLSILTGGLFAALAWLLFWGRRRPRLLILIGALIPLASVVYVVICAVCMGFVVPNQPDEFFGDFSEPLPNGYILKGLGKMPDFAYFDSEVPGRNQPATRGGVGRLEQDGQIIYGAYGHLDNETVESSGEDHGYFVFDTRSGEVRDLKTIQELNSVAGHPVQLVQSKFFRSQDPKRILLRRVEDVIYFAPPVAVALLFLFLLVRLRLRKSDYPSDHVKSGYGWPRSRFRVG
jgi:hypothetical protein